jgi:hypothetical protein
MKPTPPSNGLSVRANRCLSIAGIPAEKEAVLQALKTGSLYPYFRPTLYGKKTHQEVCRWAGLDESFRSPTTPASTRPPFVENGLSYRANGVLHRAGIPAEKEAVRHAIETGALVPGEHPYNVSGWGSTSGGACWSVRRCRHGITQIRSCSSSASDFATTAASAGAVSSGSVRPKRVCRSSRHWTFHTGQVVGARTGRWPTFNKF